MSNLFYKVAIIFQQFCTKKIRWTCQHKNTLPADWCTR